MKCALLRVRPMLSTRLSYATFRKHGFALIYLLLIFRSTSYGQFIVAGGFTANVLVSNVLVGDGVQTRNVTYTGEKRSMSLFENGDDAELGLDNGIILSNGIAVTAKGPNNVADKSDSLNWPGDKTLDKIAALQTKDAAVLEFEFKPQTKEIEFKYVFSSEEYIKYVDKGFNDVFGFFISGPGITGEENVARIPGSNAEVTIDNVSHVTNKEYFIMNDDPNSNMYKYLQHNAQTVVLKAKLELQPCEWYKIKLAIADVGDRRLNSWVFIGSKSFKHKTALGSDTVFCANNFVQTLDAGQPTNNVLWSTGERTQKIEVTEYGKYWVEVFTDCGSFKDEVNILPAIKPIDLGRDTLICGKVVDKVLELQNRVFQHYQWSNGDTTPSLHIKEPGTYWLEVSNDGCTDRDTIVVEEIDIPEFTLGGDTVLCGDIDLTLTPSISGDDYTWFDGSKSYFLKVTEPGKYWLRLDKGQCYFTDSVDITNRYPFTINIGPPELKFCERQDIRLKTQINDTSIYSIRWNTGDEVGAITVTEPGDYEVTVTDKICGYESTDQTNILFLSEGLDYYVPNAFSPNLDGLNDAFTIIMPLSQIEDYKLRVFNRWGELVYESTKYGESWDGTINGKRVEPGVYMWYASIKTPCLPDHKRYQKGTLTIMK